MTTRSAGHRHERQRIKQGDAEIGTALNGRPGQNATAKTVTVNAPPPAPRTHALSVVGRQAGNTVRRRG